MILMEDNLPKILIDGTIYTLVASLYVLLTLHITPRIWLQDFSKDIQDMVPPKTEHEKGVSFWVEISFFPVIHR